MTHSVMDKAGPKPSLWAILEAIASMVRDRDVVIMMQVRSRGSATNTEVTGRWGVGRQEDT